MRVLVIGGTGFIGKYVVRQLADLLHEVVVFHRGQTTGLLPEGVQEITGDRRRLADSMPDLQDFAPEIVVDMVLSSGAQAEEMMRVFNGTARGVVVASSMDVYRAAGILHGREEGEPDNSPLTEDSPLRKNLHPYVPEIIDTVKKMYGWVDDDYDKIPVERAIMGDPGLPGTIVRLPMVYGPGDPGRRLFPILKRIEDGRPAILLAERMAAWRGCRGYVENVAYAIALTVHLNRSAGRIYNVADQNNSSELEWTKRVAACAGFQARVIVLPESDTPPHLRLPYRLEQHWVADSSRIREELGYRETISLDEALVRTIAWERANPPAAIDPKQFDYRAEDRALASRPRKSI